MSKKTKKQPMKPSTYASLVTIVLLLHKNARSKSIASVIRSTDKLCELFEFTNTISRMTKYRIVSELLRHGILQMHSTAKNKKIFLAPSIVSLLESHHD